MQATYQPPSTKTLFGHPVGLYLLFFTEMWERFSYYGMRGLLTLFLAKEIAQGGMGFSKGEASLLYGYFTGFVYLTPIIGGWIADNYLGQRRSILIGGLLMAAGQFTLFAGTGSWLTYLGLLLIILGNGYFKPNISSIVGRLYPAGDTRRDSAFTIFYMGINLGAAIAPLVCGYLAEDYFAKKDAETMKVIEYAFQYGFLAAGIGMVLGQILFNALSQSLLGDLGKPENPKPLDSKFWLANIGTALGIPAIIATVFIVKQDWLTGVIWGVIFGVVIYFLRQVLSELKREKSYEELDRSIVIYIICTFVFFFWAGFEQAGSSLSLYTDSFIERTLGTFVVPTSWFQSINPTYIILFGAALSVMWTKLANAGKDPSIPVKMGLGMILLGLGFVFMLGAVVERGGTIWGGDVADETIKAGLHWMLLTYLFHTLGELLLSPIGLSMISKLAPPKYLSMMMGVWFLAPFAAQVAGGYLAKYVEELGASYVFTSIAAFVIVAGLVLITLNSKLKVWMHGRG